MKCSYSNYFLVSTFLLRLSYQAPEAFYNKRVTSQSESNTTATYLLRCKKFQ